MHRTTVGIKTDYIGNLIIYPSRKLHGQIKNRVNDAAVLTEGVYLQGCEVSDFIDSLTASQRRRIKREIRSAWTINIRLYDEHAWSLFGAAY